jgi:heme A synthase
MKKIAAALGVAAVALAVATATPASAAQGGFTMDNNPLMHTWLKIGRAELEQSGAMGPCLATGVGYFGCNFTVPLVNQQHSSNPRANGYWAERYYNNGQPGVTAKVRSGIW